MRVIWSPRALERAAEAHEYIARERPEAAARWLRALLAMTARLGKMPTRGQVVPALERPELRQLHHGPFRVVYRVDPKRIVILTVRHTRRQFDPSELADEDPNAAS